MTRTMVLGVMCLLTACSLGGEKMGAGATGGSSGFGGGGGVGGSGGVGADGGIGGDGGVGADGGVGGDGGVGADGGVGGVGGSGGTGGDLCSIDRVQARSFSARDNKVFNGTLSPTEVNLSAGQVLAIGMIDIDHGFESGVCSGTVIAPTWVLTAKHCTQDVGVGDLTFSVGTNPANPNVQFSIASIHESDTSDLALIELTQNAVVRVPALEPIYVFTEDLDNSWIGEIVEAAGYGLTQNDTIGTRYFTAEPIQGFSGTHVRIDGEGERGVCGGDSGGPLMTQAADGSVRVIGSLHRGDDSCLGIDEYTRVDLYLDWIESFTGPTPLPQNVPCGDLTTVGQCNGSNAMYCDVDSTVQVDACDTSMPCGWSTAAQGFRCVAAGTDPCNGVDARGECDGEVATACINGVLVTADCAACGLACEMSGQGANCEEIPVDPCDGLDFQGRCTGNTAEWCDSGMFRSLDCTTRGQVCVFMNDGNGFYCH